MKPINDKIMNFAIIVLIAMIGGFGYYCQNKEKKSDIKNDDVIQKQFKEKIGF